MHGEGEQYGICDNILATGGDFPQKVHGNRTEFKPKNKVSGASLAVWPVVGEFSVVVCENTLAQELSYYSSALVINFHRSRDSCTL